MFNNIIHLQTADIIRNVMKLATKNNRQNSKSYVCVWTVDVDFFGVSILTLMSVLVIYKCIILFDKRVNL